MRSSEPLRGWWSLLAAPAVAMLLALAVGFPTLRLRGPYFALAMLSATTAMLYLTIIYSPITGGQDGLNGLYPIIDSQREYYYLTLLFLVATGLALKLKDVSFEITPGEITGVLGPNGAGKTTLFNLLTGFIRPDRGEVRFDGHPINGLKPHRIVNLGLARTFQLARPFTGMSVLENALVGCLAPRVHAHGRSERRAREILDLVGLGSKAEQPVEVLPYGDLRRLEIARAVATKPKLIALDEPFAGLGSGEIEPLAALIRRLHAEAGLTILIIEHKLREFMQLVSRVIAIDFGEIIAIGPPAEIVRHPKVVEAYIGRAEDGDAAA